MHILTSAAIFPPIAGISTSGRRPQQQHIHASCGAHGGASSRSCATISARISCTAISGTQPSFSLSLDGSPSRVLQQQFRETGSVLAGDAGDKRFFSHVGNLYFQFGILDIERVTIWTKPHPRFFPPLLYPHSAKQPVQQPSYFLRSPRHDIPA